MTVEEKESDYSLITTFADRDDPFAQEAFTIFYEKHKSFIYKTCFDFISNGFSDEIPARTEDFMQEVMIKIYEQSNTFKVKKKVLGDNRSESDDVRVWAFTIIKNFFIDKYCRKKDVLKETILVNEENEDFIDSEINKKFSNVQEPLELDERQRRLVELALEEIENLSGKYKTIMKYYAEYGRIDEQGNWVLPSLLKQELCEKTNLAEDTVTKYKSRFVKSIRENCEQKISK